MLNSRSKKPKVSIIIPVYNEEKNIEDCLVSISQQKYKNIEIVIVDDRSTDNTAKVIKDCMQKFKIKIKLIQPKMHQERGVIRNLGAKNSKGDFLLFIDADMRLSENVVKECIDKLTSKKSILKSVIIAEESVGEGFWAKCKILEKRCYWGDDELEAARFFESRAFWSIGGWDESMISGEDWDLTHRFRNQYKIGRIKSFIYHNEGRLFFWTSVKKKYYYATHSESYLRKYPADFRHLVFFVFRPAYFRNWRILLSDPLHMIGMFVLKAFEILAGVIGLIKGKISYG